MLTAESAKDYSTARQKAFLEDWMNFFTGRPNDLLSFEEIKHNLRLQDSSFKGLQEVELDKIVGSTGRYRDFTRSFLPRNTKTEERWRQVDAISYYKGYPPIDLYKVGDVYFVRDGNHRVSVARSHGAKTIEAYVIEYTTDVPINQDDDLASIQTKMDALLLHGERQDFLGKTQLDQVRPDHQIEFTEPGRYRLVLEHIGFHKYLREKQEQREISYQDAVASWYDTVYVPIVEKIQDSRILANFPDRTEADLYAWLLLHRAQLEEDAKSLGFVPTEDLLEDLKRERATNAFAQLMGKFRGRQASAGLSPLALERKQILDDTKLDEIRPNHHIKYSEAGCYRLTKKHIEGHKYLKERDLGHEISYTDAVASWYDHVYLPIIELIRQNDVAGKFPKNTESDLYLWMVARREHIEQEHAGLGQVPDETLLEHLEAESPTGPISMLIEYFSQRKSKVSEDLEQITKESVGAIE